MISRYWSDVYGNRLYLDLGQVNGKNLTNIPAAFLPVECRAFKP